LMKIHPMRAACGDSLIVKPTITPRPASAD
jgi:hypothetical protein